MKSDMNLIKMILLGVTEFEVESLLINGVIIVFDTVKHDNTGYYYFYKKERLCVAIHQDTVLDYYIKNKD